MLPSLIAMDSYAQLQSPLITTYSKKNYGGGTQNWALETSEKGILYVGNNSGVIAFDGEEWKVTALPNKTFVRSIYLSKQRDLYVGGQNEFGYFENSVLTPDAYVSLRSLVPEEYRDFEDVWKIFESRKAIYFCTERAVFAISEGTCQVIVPEDGRFENFFFLDDQLFVQCIGHGLFVHNGNSLELHTKSDPVLENRISEIIEISGEVPLLFAQDAGIYFQDSLDYLPFSSELQAFLKEAKVYCAKRLNNGNVAIGTIQNGLVLMTNDGKLVGGLSEEQGLPNKTVLSICEDSSGNLWLGLDNGLAYVEINSPFKKVTKFSGVEGTGYAALEATDGFYFGTNLGLYHFDSGKKTSKATKVLSGQIWNLQQLNTGILINGEGGARYKLGDQINEVSEVRSSWKFLNVEKREEYFLQGTYSGLYLYRRSEATNSPLELIQKMEGFDESTRIFEEDAKGDIWVSHAYRGLFRLTPDYESLKFTEVKKFGKDDGLPDDYYITVSKIRGEIVFSTESGVFRFDSSTETFRVHDEITKLLGENKNVQRLIEDEQGNFWFSTKKEFGLVEIEQKGVFNDVEVIYFNQIQDDLVDGFENVYTSKKAFSFIPIEGGYYTYDLGQSKNSPEFEYPLRIDEVFSTKGNDSLIYVHQHGGLSKPIILHSEDTDIRFHFNLPNFGQLNEVSYSYKLSGDGEGWSEWSPHHTKEYSNLASGDYSFSVKAKNGFGRVSEPVGFNFTIPPPWYKTTVARIVWVILGFLLVISFVRYVSLREAKKTELIKKQSILTIKQKEEAHRREKEKSEGEIIRLRNEKLRSEVSHKNAELASTTMHLVQKSEMLQNVKKELSELSKQGSDQLKTRIRQIQRLISDDVRLDKNWERFETHFDQVHENFFKNLRAAYPDLTPKDQKLCAYLRMNLATKEIAPLLNISVRGVEISRYRLRKKLNLQSDVNLVTFIMEI